MATKKKVPAKKPAAPAKKPVAPVKKKPKVVEEDELEETEEAEDLEMSDEFGAETSDELADQDEEEIEGDEIIDEGESEEDAQEAEEELEEDTIEADEIVAQSNSRVTQSAKAVALRAPTAVGKAASLSSWGKPKVSSQDVIMPRIQLLQQMSPRVATPAEGQKPARLGQYRDSLSDRLLGDPEHPMLVIPFHMTKIWVIYKLENNKGKNRRVFEKIEQVTPENETRRTQYVDNKGTNYELDKVMTFFVLLPSDVKKSPNPMAYTISFRRTGLMAGKKLATQMFVTNSNEGKVPAAYAMNIHSMVVTGDNIYAKPDVSRGRATTTEELEAAYKWYQLAESGQAKVDEEELASETAGGQAKPAPNVEDTEY
jgi:hypothetical protein